MFATLSPSDARGDGFVDFSVAEPRLNVHVLEKAHHLGVYAPTLEKAPVLRDEGCYPFSLIVGETERELVGTRVSGFGGPPQGHLADRTVKIFSQIDEEDEDAESGGGTVGVDLPHHVRGEVSAATTNAPC